MNIKKYIVNLILFALFTMYSVLTQAQLQQGLFLVNIGVGYSPEFDGDFLGFSPVTPNPFIVHETNNFTYLPITPNLGGMIDYSLNAKTSIGIAASYQSETVIYSLPPPCSDKVIRINIAFRYLYHLNKRNPLFDNYMGVRFGCSYWQDIPSAANYFFTPPPLYFLGTARIVVPSFQFLYGLRYFIINNVGLHFEFAIGSPYLAEGGLTFRINTHKSKPAQENSPAQGSYGGHGVK